MKQVLVLRFSKCCECMDCPHVMADGIVAYMMEYLLRDSEGLVVNPLHRLFTDFSNCRKESTHSGAKEICAFIRFILKTE